MSATRLGQIRAQVERTHAEYPLGAKDARYLLEVAEANEKRIAALETAVQDAERESMEFSEDVSIPRPLWLRVRAVLAELEEDRSTIQSA